jgi:hypothetical protein
VLEKLGVKPSTEEEDDRGTSFLLYHNLRLVS